MIIYAIQVSHGDGYTYSAETLDFFHTDKEYLQDLCDTFTILNEYEHYEFSVVTVNVDSNKFSDEYIRNFKDYWSLEDL